MTAPTLLPPSQAADLGRRLERFRQAIRSAPGEGIDPLPQAPIPSADLAERLATTLGADIVASPLGRYVRVDGPVTEVPVDRERLARLPGQPPADRPLVCLDTETTGLATAAGTVAFLIGLGWWVGPTFRQVQLLLPDHADEAALLDELARHVPPDAWLVTYNGRGFDWPLLVARYRLARRAAPTHDGHLDLLPIVRRLFRHRMDDARLQTVERNLLGVERHDDVDGWEIPGRYLGFLRGGPAHPLLAVVRHNDEDVRSLGRLVAHIDRSLGDPATRHRAPRGDLAGLGRAFRRERRLDEALACLDDALVAEADPPRPPSPARDRRPATTGDEWWSPGSRADFGGPPQRHAPRTDHGSRAAFDRPWDDERIGIDRAHLLRRLGRTTEAIEAWDALSFGAGRSAILAVIEAAKLREHHTRDPRAALATVERGLGLVDRRRRRGLPEPALELDLHHRAARLRRRLNAVP